MTQTTSANQLLRVPATNEHVMLDNVVGATVALEFDTGAASVARSGNNLVFTFSDEASTTIENFFVTEGEPLPTLLLQDGLEVSSVDMLASLNSTMDLSTTAGPSASANSSGVSDYADAPGDMIGGIDRLGSLGTDQWGRTTEVVERQITPSLADGDSGGDDTTPAVPVTIYDARAVLYTNDYYTYNSENSADPNRYELKFNLLQGGSPITTGSDLSIYTLNFVPASGAQYFTYDPATDFVNGVLTLHLTQAGLDALAAGKNIYNYLEIIAPGEDPYTMQIIADPTNSLSSPTEDTHGDPGGALAPGGLIHGEWHAGRGFEAENNTLDSSGLGDSIIFTEGMTADAQNSTINTHTIAGKHATVTLERTDDDPTAQAALFAQNSGTNTINGGNPSQGVASGTTDVTITSQTLSGILATGANSANVITNVTDVTINAALDGMKAADGSSNTIEHAHNLTINAGDKGIASEGTNSKTTIKDVNDITVVAGGVGISSDANSTTTISDAGFVTIKGEYGGISANDHSSTEVSNVKDINISSLEGNGISASDNSSNSISHAGNVTIAGKIGISATNHSSNTITDVKNVDITGETAGISAEQSSTNTIKTDGNVTIEVGSTSSTATNITGTYADVLSENSIEGSHVSITASGGANSIVSGLYTTKTSVAFNQPSTTNITATGAGSASDPNVSITVEGGKAYGVYGSGDAPFANVITANNTDLYLDIDVKGGTSAHGMYAKNGAVNSTQNAANVNITSTSDGTGSGAYGLYVEAGGKNEINTIEAHILTTAYGASAMAKGLYSNGSGTNTLNLTGTSSAEKSTITAHAAHAARGVESYTAHNIINAQGSLDITANAINNAEGVFAYGGTNTIKLNQAGAAGPSTISAISGKNAYGIESTNKSTTTIDAKGELIVHAESGTKAEGVSSTIGFNNGIVTGTASHTTINADDLTINATVHTVTSAALGNSGTAFGINATYGSSNTLTVTDSISVIATGGQAYGMHADHQDLGIGAKNTIQAAGSTGITVNITVTGDQGKNVYAMWANNDGHNEILGGAGADSISLTGDIRAQNGGTNTIDTGAGNDILQLNGAIDSIGSLDLIMGDGFDILVLHAQDITEFTARYETWLSAQDASIMSVESIQISGLDSGDIPSWLTSWAGANGVPLSIYGGEHTFTDLQGMSLDADASYIVSGGSEMSNQTLTLGNGEDYFTLNGDVTNVTANMGAGNDYIELQGALNNSAIHGGSGIDVLNINGLVTQGSDTIMNISNLFSDANTYTGIEVITLDGDVNKVLTLDMSVSDLLSHLQPDAAINGTKFDSGTDATLKTTLETQGEVLRIHGDSADTINIGDYTARGDITYDSVAYTAYEDTNGQLLLIQSGMNIV